MFKIFVGNLDYKVRPEQVRELFTLYGPIEDLVIPTDPKTKKPRGFAIVMMRDPELGAAAVRGVQGKRLMGRELVVNEALKKKGGAPVPAVEPPRSGPFGPRLFRKADGRSRGSRNPRRSAGSGPSSPPPAPPGASVRPSGGVASGASAAPIRPLSVPAGSRPGARLPGTAPKVSGEEVFPNVAPVKARPKMPPPPSSAP